MKYCEKKINKLAFLFKDIIDHYDPSRSIMILYIVFRLFT